MVAVSITDSALYTELGKAFQAFRYVALDASTTAYVTSQIAPLSECPGTYITGGNRQAATTNSLDPATGIVTLSKQYIFTGVIVVGSVCLMNSATTGCMLLRYVPASGLLPAAFGDGGSLLITITCQFTRPA
jgi:hypothetical protein